VSLESWSEVVEGLEVMPAAMRIERQRRGLSLRAVAAESGVPFTNVVRTEQGVNVTLHTLMGLLNWLDWSTNQSVGGAA
jgi:transcriptional regulator with XRE-family HTH domain